MTDKKLAVATTTPVSAKDPCRWVRLLVAQPDGLMRPEHARRLARELLAAADEADPAPAVRFRKLHPDAQIPRRMTEGAAGLDVFAYIERPPYHNDVVDPGQTIVVRTGIAMQLPSGFEGQVRPRSGLAREHGVTVLNAPGTIDADYRGEIEVLLVNLGSEQHIVNHGDRIAQLVVAPVVMAEPVEVEELEPTERGAGGFGSTDMPAPLRASDIPRLLAACDEFDATQRYNSIAPPGSSCSGDGWATVDVGAVTLCPGCKQCKRCVDVLAAGERTDVCGPAVVVSMPTKADQ